VLNLSMNEPVYHSMEQGSRQREASALGVVVDDSQVTEVETMSQVEYFYEAIAVIL